MFKPRKILVVDDSQIIREMLSMMLVKGGYEVIFAEDGESAVKNGGKSEARSGDN